MTISHDQLAEALGVTTQYREPPIPAHEIKAQRIKTYQWEDAPPDSVNRHMREARLKEMEGRGRDR